MDEANILNRFDLFVAELLKTTELNLKSDCCPVYPLTLAYRAYKWYILCLK